MASNFLWLEQCHKQTDRETYTQTLQLIDLNGLGIDTVQTECAFQQSGVDKELSYFGPKTAVNLWPHQANVQIPAVCFVMASYIVQISAHQCPRVHCNTVEELVEQHMVKWGR